MLTILATVSAANLYGDFVLWPRLAQLDESKRRFWLRVLDRLILGFSDQQLVTGICILLIGFISICRISNYHFLIINNLGMFSCSSHLASVLSLRRYFQEHPTVAKIRITATSIFAILLATSVVLVGFIPLSVNLKCSAICAAKGSFSSLPRILGIIMALYLIVAYWAALAYVFPNAEIKFMTWFNTKPAQWLEKALGPMGVGYHFQERFMHYKPIPALRVSFFLQFLWWVASLGASSWVRAEGGKVVGGSEAIWTFGQMLALLMITLPFLTAAEIYLGMI